MNKHGWTPERRARQAEMIHRWKPWTKSTGPRTLEGKIAVSINPIGTGCRRFFRLAADYLRRQDEIERQSKMCVQDSESHS